MTVTEPAGGAHSRSVLERALMRGLAGTRAITWITTALSWTSTLVVAHLLSPDDYGIAGATVLFISLVQLVNEFGLGAAVVSSRTRCRTPAARGRVPHLVSRIVVARALRACT
jgi:hypothetical protein